MREIVLDTETTGLDIEQGHRLVEIAGLELINHIPTGNRFHRYVNPEAEMSDGAFAVHGLTAEFLSRQPVFAEIVAAFLEFIGDGPLVIHNAEFDLKFINVELERLGSDHLPATRAIDTLRLARRKFPGAPASLDALCKRFAIDNTARTLHGALLDAELLSEVYLELIGGRQSRMELTATDGTAARAAGRKRATRPPRPHAASAEELAAHAALLAKLKNPIWTQE